MIGGLSEDEYGPSGIKLGLGAHPEPIGSWHGQSADKIICRKPTATHGSRFHSDGDAPKDTFRREMDRKANAPHDECPEWSDWCIDSNGLAWIRREGAPVQSGDDAERNKPCEEQSHQRGGHSPQFAFDSSEIPRRELTRFLGNPEIRGQAAVPPGFILPPPSRMFSCSRHEKNPHLPVSRLRSSSSPMMTRSGNDSPIPRPARRHWPN